MANKTVYIASPYRIGDVATNVRKSMDVAAELMDLGFVPFVPLLSHFLHMVHPRSEDFWIEYDLEWVSRCDYLLRLPGESKGADQEVDFAERNGIPVVYSVRELLQLVEFDKELFRRRAEAENREEKKETPLPYSFKGVPFDERKGLRVNVQLPFTQEGKGISQTLCYEKIVQEGEESPTRVCGDVVIEGGSPEAVAKLMEETDGIMKAKGFERTAQRTFYGR